MDLFKTNGQIKPRKALWPHYVEYRTEIARKQFEDEMRIEHATLFPLKIQNGVDEFNDPVIIDNPAYISFDSWMDQDRVTQVGQDAVYAADGITLISPAVPELRELVRPFIPPTVLESELDAYLLSSPEYKRYLEGVKDGKLARVTVKTTSGKEFYADPLSRVDISDAVQVGIEEGATKNLTDIQVTTSWKLVTGWATVTLADMKEAQRLGLEAKGAIIQ